VPFDTHRRKRVKRKLGPCFIAKFMITQAKNSIFNGFIGVINPHVGRTQEKHMHHGLEAF